MHTYDTKKVIINKKKAEIRLDKALSSLIPEYSRSQIKILLENKNVKISNKIISNASYKVKEGEIYYIKIPKLVQSRFASQDIPLDIVYEDSDILLINKTSGMVTHPAPNNQNNTLVNALIHYTNNELSSVNNSSRPGIVHRLDKDTSGLIVIAKNNLAHLHLAKQFKDHSIMRKYYAIVWGIPNNQKIVGYIQRHKINRKKMALNKTDGKYSETSIKLLKTFDICSLIECSLMTGRTHQVRVHMNSINHPLVGDKIYGKNKISKYGNKKENFNKFLILKNFNRQALHAFTIGFNHPISNKKLEYTSKLPQDMLKLLEFISKY